MLKYLEGCYSVVKRSQVTRESVNKAVAGGLGYAEWKKLKAKEDREKAKAKASINEKPKRKARKQQAKKKSSKKKKSEIM